MKRTVFIALILTAVTAHAGDKEIFLAMDAELERGMKDLRIQGLEAPYFISLTLQDATEKMTTFEFSALSSDSVRRGRNIQAVVRAGTSELDNTNYLGFDAGGMSFSQTPYDDDVPALRKEFWLAIDRAYKGALDALSKKQGYLEKHPQEEYPRDFLPVERITDIRSCGDGAFDAGAARTLAATLAGSLRRYSFLEEATVRLRILESSRYYLDSEGNRFVRCDPVAVLVVELETYTTDWYMLGDSLRWVVRRASDLPAVEEALTGIENAAAYLQAVRELKPMEEYSGPVVFAEDAAGAFFLDVLGRGVSSPREFLADRYARGYFERSLGREGVLARRFGRRVLPRTFNVWDRPNETAWGDSALMGYLPVDDEGVQSKDIQLVRAGKLVAYPMRRTATKKYNVSNGHARATESVGRVAGRVTTLFVEDTEGRDEQAFKEMIRETALDQDIEEVLVVTKLGGRGPQLLGNPSRMYMLNVASGARRPVWGLVFRDATERSLRDILASTKQRALYQTVSFFPHLVTTPMGFSVIAPEILLEEMILQKTRSEKIRPPDVAMPPIAKAP